MDKIFQFVVYLNGMEHTVFSQALGSEPIEDFAEMAGIECVKIAESTQVRDITNELRWNRGYYER